MQLEIGLLGTLAKFMYNISITRSRKASNSPRDREDDIRTARKYLNGAGPLYTSFSISI